VQLYRIWLLGYPVTIRKVFLYDGASQGDARHVRNSSGLSMIQRPRFEALMVESAIEVF